ncbi:hypothetical protein QA596_04565 [Balneolales bacterium ANBcel1]|nr:hypothetical protein [Balneolales bacterium ANBcel1]
MLLRLITAISLLVFALLLMSGTQIDMALYRSLVVFLILFAGAYLTIFFLNVMQESNHTKASPPATASGNNKGGSEKNSGEASSQKSS